MGSLSLEGAAAPRSSGWREGTLQLSMSSETVETEPVKPARRARKIKPPSQLHIQLSSEAAALAEEDCTICYDKMGDDTATLGCSHSFCFPCIDTWRKSENSCPLCKGKFTQISRLRKVGNKFRKCKVRVANKTQNQTGQAGQAGHIGYAGHTIPIDGGGIEGLFNYLFNHFANHDMFYGVDNSSEDEDYVPPVADDDEGTPLNPIIIYDDVEDDTAGEHLHPIATIQSQPRRAGEIIDLTRESDDEPELSPSQPLPSAIWAAATQPTVHDLFLSDEEAEGSEAGCIDDRPLKRRRMS